MASLTRFSSLNSIFERFVGGYVCSESTQRVIYGFKITDNNYLPELLPSSTTDFSKCVDASSATVMGTYMTNHTALYTNDYCLVYGTYKN